MATSRDVRKLDQKRATSRWKTKSGVKLNNWATNLFRWRKNLPHNQTGVTSGGSSSKAQPPTYQDRSPGNAGHVRDLLTSDRCCRHVGPGLQASGPDA